MKPASWKAAGSPGKMRGPERGCFSGAGRGGQGFGLTACHPVSYQRDAQVFAPTPNWSPFSVRGVASLRCTGAPSLLEFDVHEIGSVVDGNLYAFARGYNSEMLAIRRRDP